MDDLTASQQFDFGTPGMKDWTEQDPFWQRLEGSNQVCPAGERQRERPSDDV